MNLYYVHTLRSLESAMRDLQDYRLRSFMVLGIKPMVLHTARQVHYH
jgi:hypothetical protein